MPRRRILTVVDRLGDDGISNQIFEIAGRLPRSRYDLRFVSLFGGGAAEERLRETKVRVYELSLPGRYPLLRAGWTLRRMVGQMKIDLIHAYHPRSAVAARLAAWGQAPLVTTRAVAVAEDDPNSWFRLLDRITRRWVNENLLAETEDARRVALEAGIREVEVLPPFLDVEGFRSAVEDLPRSAARTRLGFGRDHVVLVHVGDFDARREQEKLLQALAIALREDPRLRLALAGDGPTLTDARVMAEELDLGDAVLFLGPLEEQAVLYGSADAYVQPGPVADAGHPLLRAMAAGVPVVAAEDAGVAPYLGAAAHVAEGGRVEDLARSILDLASDGDARRKLAARARERAASFDTSGGLARLDAVYRGLTG